MTGPDDPAAGNKRPRQVTIIDVAKAADVAVGTVSNHLNGQAIRRSNRIKIERAIEALGYRRNAAAVAMKTDQTKIVGLMVSNLDEYHAGILEHLALGIDRADRALLIYCNSLDPRRANDGLALFASQRVNALITSGTGVAAESVGEFLRAGVPVIVYNNDIPGIGAERVFVNNRGASRRAVTHFVDMGHRRLAIITGNPIDSTSEERLRGYLDVLQERSIPVRQDYIQSGHWFIEGGRAAMQRLMILKEPPTAVFVSNYLMASGAIAWLLENGYVIPRDVSLISFDDVPSHFLMRPGITAIPQPLARVAEAIINVLIDRLAHPEDQGGRTAILECDIILRDSVRRI